MVFSSCPSASAKLPTRAGVSETNGLQSPSFRPSIRYTVLMRFRIPSLELPPWVGYLGAGFAALAFLYLFPDPYPTGKTKATYWFALVPEDSHWALSLAAAPPARAPDMAIQGRIDTEVEIPRRDGRIDGTQITSADVITEATPSGMNPMEARKVLDA